MRTLPVWLILLGCGAPARESIAPVVLPQAPPPRALPCAENQYEPCRIGCEGGSQNDCALASTMLYQGIGTPVDKQRARDLARRSCDAGVFRGCNVLGLIHEDAREKDRALELFRRACDGKEWRGCANLGRVRIEEGNAAEGIRLHEQACRMGGTSSCIAAASRLAPGQPNPDATRAAEMFRLGCEGGDLDACNGLGTCYARGEGVPRNDARAIELFTRACDGNVGIGCKGLGDMFASTDPTRAQAAYKRSCDLGYKRGCEHVGP